MSPAFLILSILMFALWLAGGGSRPDLLGQVVVRSTAFISLVLAALIGVTPSIKATRPVGAILFAVLLLLVLQLVPLPWGLWTALPGRNDLLFADELSGETQLWRPLAVVPSAALNATFSIFVPLIVFLLLSSLKEDEYKYLPSLVLLLATASMIVGLIQFSEAGYNNIFVNDTPGEVSGNFANRNHFALFLSIGCLIAPVWAFAGGSAGRWRAPLGLGLILLFILTILASGSRAGIITGVIAVVVGLIVARSAIEKTFGYKSRWIFPVLIFGVFIVMSSAVVLSIFVDRAVSIDRAIALEATGDMRTRGLPVVIRMISTYFPFGSGAGSFDPLFRMNEPISLLKLTYFNHAHNEYLEIALDTGLPGLLLLGVAMGWWLLTSLRAWRAPGERLFQRLGSAVLLLVFVASAFDYPARTPFIMAMIVVAAVWLAKSETVPRSALPGGSQQL
ncbi:O-antigen ligase family protein [Sphingomonas hankookensis]